MPGMKRNLIKPVRRYIVTHVVNTQTRVLLAQFSRQRRHEALRRERKQAAIRHLIETVAERVIRPQREAAPLLRISQLQS